MDLSGYVVKRTPIKIGTKDFVFRELSMGDLAKFRAFLSDKKKAYNQDRRERIIADAARIGNIDPMELLKFADSNISQDEVEAEMESVEGISYLAYLSLKYKYPEISIEQAADIITPLNLEKITAAMFPSDVKPKPDKKKLPKQLAK